MAEGQARRFTLGELHARTVDVEGGTRMAVFHELPAALQREAWTDLAAWAAYRNERDFEEVDHGS